MEEAERKKLEDVIKREQKQQELIKEKEREILQLQVGLPSIVVYLLLFHLSPWN